YRLDYGFEFQVVGDRCFVTHVRPKNDAEEKGVKPGDENVALNGYNVSRDVLWKMRYVFNVLRPQKGLALNLQDPAGTHRQLDVLANMRMGKKVMDLTGGGGGGDIWDIVRQGETDEHLMRARYQEYGDIFVIKLPAFLFSESEVANMIGKARKQPKLILDLRSNPGGSVDTLKYLVGEVFEKETKIADRVGRKETKPEVAKSLHNPFTGKMVVLVDSNSASAAELFVRIIQLEKRGVILGDRTSGS